MMIRRPMNISRNPHQGIGFPVLCSTPTAMPQIIRVNTRERSIESKIDCQIILILKNKTELIPELISEVRPGTELGFTYSGTLEARFKVLYIWPIRRDCVNVELLPRSDLYT